jgi:hypothetical protein
MEIKITNDVEIEKLSYYNTIVDIVSRLDKSHVLNNLHGNCIAAADIVTAMLLQSGIESVITECQASVRVDHDGQQHFNLVGYDNFSFNGQVDTHVVVITKTAIPILIDLSISQYLPEEHPFIVEKVDNSDPSLLGSYKFDNCHVIYQTKRNIRLPELHQKTILERISEDAKAKTKFKTLNNLVYALLGFTTINLLANILIVFLKLN